MSVIQIENLSKKYNLYQNQEDRIKETFHPFRKKYHKEFFALKNISFKVEHGEVIGIIGKNGAGKSTLLKILTGVLTQSSGTFSINGRVSALLELGGGINPDYTGIENIYFNGSILGLSKKEIDSKLQEIISFADIDDFINIPVKTYSSGMMVRLAFAIAINIEPDILIVDEALSVGDIRFQQKSLRKMRELMDSSKAILFVTHDIGTVLNFCSKVIWLKDGEIYKIGEPQKVCKQYLSYMAFNDLGKEATADKNTTNKAHDTDIKWVNTEKFESYGERNAQIEKVFFSNKNDNSQVDLFSGNEKCILKLSIKSDIDIHNPIYGFILKDHLGNEITGMNTVLYNMKNIPLKRNSEIEVNIIFTLPNIKNGEYTISPAIAEGTITNHIQQHWIHDAIAITVYNNDIASSIGWYYVLEGVNTEIKFKS